MFLEALTLDKETINTFTQRVNRSYKCYSPFAPAPSGCGWRQETTQMHVLPDVACLFEFSSPSVLEDIQHVLSLRNSSH